MRHVLGLSGGKDKHRVSGTCGQVPEIEYFLVIQWLNSVRHRYLERLQSFLAKPIEYLILRGISTTELSHV